MFFIQEELNAIPKSKTVLNKSILLDKYENSIKTSTDPLGLNNRKYLTLDILMIKLPNLRPSNFYLTRKVCPNCQLAYSIIDIHRYKYRNSRKPKRKSSYVDLSFSNMQTKLSFTTNKFVDNVNKFEKRMQFKKKQEYKSMKNILIPVGRSTLSEAGKKLLSRIVYDSDYDSEKEDKMPFIKEARTTSFGASTEICELAKSIIEKPQFIATNKTLKPSKSLPFNFK